MPVRTHAPECARTEALNDIDDGERCTRTLSDAECTCGVEYERGAATAAEARLCAYVLAEARNAHQWHKGGMRVATAPRLSRRAALDILDMAWRMGLAEDPHQ